MSDTLRVGIAGLGTVGCGVVRLIDSQHDRLARRIGRPIAVTAVSARDRGRDRGIDLTHLRWHDDARRLADDPAVDVVVELIGGAEGIAKALTEAAFAAGKPVVTANKALLAEHGSALALAAEAAGVGFGFEAAVAAGIPIIKAIREGLAGNAISRLYGILNGTSNYILTRMRQTGEDFSAALGEATALGYAEADPSFDVDGIDAAHKLAILSSLAFGTRIDFAAVHVEGIREISALDIAYAEELGFRVKLLAVTQLTDHGLAQRVHPALVLHSNPMAHVDGVFNAVVAESNFAGRTVFEGQGAGAGPTASAVAADIIDIAGGRALPPFGIPATALAAADHSPMGRHAGSYYLRLTVYDRPGVIADVAAILRDEAISIDSMLQRGRAARGAVPVVLITHEAEESHMRRALALIDRLNHVLEPTRMIRIEASC